jgi:hypothetical protein
MTGLEMPSVPPQSKRDDEQHNKFRGDTTTERVIGDRQYSVDEGEGLVYKLNKPSSLIIQR